MLMFILIFLRWYDVIYVYNKGKMIDFFYMYY